MLSGTEKLERRYPQAMRLIAESRAPVQTLEAAQLMAGGFVFREIGEEMGISVSRAQELLRDPLLEIAARRKARGLRPCVDCGAPCNTGGSITEPSKRCGACNHARNEAEAKWKPEAVLDAIRRWVDSHGEPPYARDWNTASNPHPDWSLGDYPSWNTVGEKFGTFNKGVEAAGFKPRYPIGGQPRRPLTKEQLAETAALVEMFGLEGAADRLGMKVSGVKRRLKQHAGIPTGDNRVPPTLKAEDVIAREIAKNERVIAKYKDKVDEAAEQIERLRIAQSALQNGSPAVPSAA